MPVKPTDSEEEYFARQEMERRRKLAEQHKAEMAAEEREKQRALHFMRCPKCGMELEEIEFGGVQIDECSTCGGIWFDKGELERVKNKGEGFMGRLLGVFRS